MISEILIKHLVNATILITWLGAIGFIACVALARGGNYVEKVFKESEHGKTKTKNTDMSS